MNDRDRKELREAGASDELIRTIDTALTYAEKKKVTKALKNINKMNRLYQIVLNNYKSKDEKQLARAIKAAKEFIRRFGNEEIASRNTEWLKYSIPKWEQRLQKVSRVSTTNH